LINFVSNIPRDLRSGGFSAMSAAAYKALCKVDNVHYAGPINPPVILRQKLASKLSRTMGLKGNFFAFSRERLDAIAAEVEERCAPDAQFDFFHGFTPWVLTRPPRPYVTWSDCTFRDYIDIYHHREMFQLADIGRIEDAEARWLAGAHRIGFSSAWAARRAVNYYGCDASRVRVVGNFGEVEAPKTDEYAGAKTFAFVSTNFEAKGGYTLLSAFQKLRRWHPTASVVVVGAQPSNCAQRPGVSFTGYLRKEVPSESATFNKILAASRALVHPTKSDISPLIIIEASFFGCPAIAPNRFAIPELVDDGVTGILLQDMNQNELVDAMNWMLENEAEYQEMRKRSRAKVTTHYSKAAFESRMQALIER
jgi:glycosyltransferase involved in cell wall biosynthesis